MHDSVYIWNNIEWIKALQMNCSALFSQVIEMLVSIYLYSSVVWLGLINLLGILDLMLDLLFNGKLRFSEWKAETPWPISAIICPHEKTANLQKEVFYLHQNTLDERHQWKENSVRLKVDRFR